MVLFVHCVESITLHLNLDLFLPVFLFPSIFFFFLCKMSLISPTEVYFMSFLSRSCWRPVSQDALCRLIQRWLVSRRGSRWPWSWSVSPAWPLCGPPGPSVVAIAVDPHFCHLWINQQLVPESGSKFSDISLLLHLYAAKRKLWLFHVSVWWFYNPPATPGGINVSSNMSQEHAPFKFKNNLKRNLNV